MTPVDPVKAFDALTQGLANGFVIAAAVGYFVRRLRGRGRVLRSGGSGVPPPRPTPPTPEHIYIGWTEDACGQVRHHFWHPGKGDGS